MHKEGQTVHFHVSVMHYLTPLTAEVAEGCN
jgi:hypothetical protein